MLGATGRQAGSAARAAFSGRLPARYSDESVRQFFASVEPLMCGGATVLDVGSGRRPVCPPQRRAAAIHYVGLDLSAQELAKAPERSYDEVVVSDVSVRVPALVGRFDLILSWHVLEHVRNLRATLENLREYLRPGGRFSALLSGRWSAFAVANSVLPAKMAAAVASRVTARDADTVFPAHYDRCTASQLEGLTAEWTRSEIVPLWLGAGYFAFLPPLQAAYLGYEEWAMLTDRRDLATHYFLHLER